ncbi:ABC transporter ATP-binding protein [uncultured Lamprocystis sp.]|jgi:putative ABC transport system ATP-binding protein|uniref:ABC transporter ATP-binding protein n=1 Tax=uncultured Lamprocystis sp. TaxID=543132 RepID=UPI0025D8BF69|nr:ATP-binding cassette domain-containing protein [uncultured Lamprocystis sp.]
MAPSPPVYLCQGLTKRRAGGGTAFELRVPELRIAPGEVVVLQGASGSGKSTLLDLLALALRPDQAGTFSFRPEHRAAADLWRLWERDDLDGLGQLRGTHIGYVLQTGGLLSFLTARENIALSCRLLGRDPGGLIERLAERLNISAQLDKRPGQLSVGERQRVAIARALAHRPGVVLADEPTASVDPLNAARILDLFLDLVRQSGACAVIASHDWRPERLPGVRVLEHRIERDGDLTRSLFWG